ncbi:FMN-dependent NADH-azoreductase [Robbsia andropogonis]|uniref:FMN-dependent NADH-azoreductase n=1 Tax=Robbsia andropogonis TaxID=28092 RepID=UPI0020A2166F|nr:NAD(P)H-dependent oxidoreductase [Robbsia andropogonis]MCP1121154.1 NAD(P)H-dependent oxidoreductase [Robbsia andropogonis]MCP1130947.1 NAD(P)H-dependent oxidoreductase [Robbsia andropogonis]
MTAILQINGAARSQGANSTLLANETTAHLKAKHPGATVVVRDLLSTGLPLLGDEILGAFFTPAESRSDAQKAIVARSDALIDELRAADIVVIGAPLYNFADSTQLKGYLDWITRAGVTFRYTPEGTPEGLIKGKKVIVAAARGGKYTGTPMDVQTPYLKLILGFLGMTDVTFVYAEGFAMGPDAAALALSSAREAIAAL